MDIELNNKFLNAALNNNVPAVRAFLKTPGVLPNFINKSGQTALMWAARRGHTILVKALLAAPGILINQASAEDGATALIWAAKNGNKPAVQVLLDAPDILRDQKNHAGKTASEIAFDNGYLDIMDLLKQKPGIPATPKEPINTTLPTLVKPKPVTFSIEAKSKTISLENNNKAGSKCKPIAKKKGRPRKGTSG